jgi:hypothetical protein
VDDLDMLSIDHLNNDGHKDREKNGGRSGGGGHFYMELLKRGLPEGFQTLCFNHQIKKHLMHLRG